MLRRLFLFAVALAVCCSAQAQNAPPSEAAKSMVGTWEFSTAERDKSCTAKFSVDPARVGYRVVFDAECGKLFPMVRQVVGWRFPQEDLLYLLDPQGKAIIEFSEVEDGIFEAPTPGVGVLFLQNPAAAAAGPRPEPTGDVAGNWAMVRGDGTSVCILTLAGGGSAVTPQAGCDPNIVKLGFKQWRVAKGELVLVPASGEPWRFEDADGNWRQLSNSDDQVMLVRQ